METANNKSMNSKDEVSYWDNILDEYENSIGLPKYNAALMSEEELSKYLSMNRDEIEKLTPEDCGQIAYRLSQFSFHTQRTINREQARYDWSEDTIKSIIADEINSYKGYGYVEKSLQAIKHNEKASSLEKIRKYAKQRLNRLSYLATSINNMSNILLNIQKMKVKNG
jgi:hypothetical protein